MNTLKEGVCAHCLLIEIIRQLAKKKKKEKTIYITEKMI